MTRLLKITVVCQGASMLFYPAALPLSRQTRVLVRQDVDQAVGDAVGCASVVRADSSYARACEDTLDGGGLGSMSADELLSHVVELPGVRRLPADPPLTTAAMVAG